MTNLKLEESTDLTAFKQGNPRKPGNFPSPRSTF